MKKIYDVITFGSATQDIYVKSKKFSPVAKKSFAAGRGICFPAGSKIEVEDILLSSGGGGTNTAATFTKQGLKTAWCGRVGDDSFGNLIIKELGNLKIDTTFISKTKDKLTNTSVFLAYPGKDRTILVYRGASDSLGKNDIPWSKIKNAKWFYLAPFAGNFVALTEKMVNFAKKNKIKVALNPGYNQLTLPRKNLERILAKVDILILNREEASLLTKIPYQKEKAIFKKLDELVHGICIMTKGGQGVVVSDGRYLYRAPSLYPEIVASGLKFIDSTGAGDAFGSGFVVGMIQKNNIVFAIQLAMANSGYVITKWGAKNGLLKKGRRWPKTKVTKELCLENGLCQIKK